MKWLVYGSKGWIGRQFCDILDKSGETVIEAKSRADDEIAVETELIIERPDRVVSLIGRTSGPGYSTIDYLEQKGKLVENMQDNLYGPCVLAMLCSKHDIHFTYLGTGCIFDGYEGFGENARPNFFGSSYSTVKGFTDRMMHLFSSNVLNCRIRMPITADDNNKNFITKIRKYKKICSTPNSMTVLPEILPIMVDMIRNRLTGTINLTNPGLITHNEILQMVKEILDPELTWENFSIEEQSQVLLAGRSNNLLNTDRLEQLYPQILSIKDSVRKVIYQM